MKVAVIRVSEVNRILKDCCCNCRKLLENTPTSWMEVQDVPVRPEIQVTRLDDLRKEVANEFNMTEETFLEKNGTKERVRVRREYVKRARSMGYSFPVIGRSLGMHHTSVMHLYRTGSR